MGNLVLCVAFLILFTSVGLGQQEFVDGVDLTTIKAPWTMRILGNDLDIADVKVKPDERSAYFMMTSESTKLNVSVFIEPVDKCKSSEECRDYTLNLGNPAWGKFQDLAKGKIKDFHYFEFYRPDVKGQPLKVLDMYAEYVDQGYWIDLHISKVLYKKEDHALFEKVVNSVAFVAKVGKGSSAFDGQIASGQRTIASWLELWENGKCRESPTALSPLTKADNPESGWVELCKKVNDFLGKNKSRNLVAAAFTRSLPGKTDRPLAVIAYQSDFPKRSAVVEIIALILEKDGRWVITNYLPR